MQSTTKTSGLKLRAAEKYVLGDGDAVADVVETARVILQPQPRWPRIERLVLDQLRSGFQDALQARIDGW